MSVAHAAIRNDSTRLLPLFERLSNVKFDCRVVGRALGRDLVALEVRCASSLPLSFSVSLIWFWP